MKSIILRLILAVVTFAFGVAIDRAVVSRRAAPAPAPAPVLTNNLDPSCDTPAQALSPTDAPDPILLFDFNLDKFDPNGSYFPLRPLPKEFGDVAGFDLAVDLDEGEVLGSAYVETRSNDGNDSPSAEFLLITERRVFFVTSACENTGFAYRFDGKFLANPASQMDKGKAVVRGTLSKMKNGRTVAECEASFKVEFVDC